MKYMLVVIQATAVRSSVLNWRCASKHARRAAEIPAIHHPTFTCMQEGFFRPEALYFYLKQSQKACHNQDTMKPHGFSSQSFHILRPGAATNCAPQEPRQSSASEQPFALWGIWERICNAWLFVCTSMESGADAVRTLRCSKRLYPEQRRFVAQEDSYQTQRQGPIIEATT